jgi:hypothetical protein
VVDANRMADAHGGLCSHPQDYSPYRIYRG